MIRLPFFFFAQTKSTLSALAWIKVIVLMVAPLALYADERPRLISTDAGVTELIFSLGLENELIAIDVTSQLPQGFPALPSIGYHRTLSAEGLMSLNPSVVIGSEHIGPASVVTALKQAEVKFVQLRSAKSSDQLRDNVLSLAEALGQKERGQRLLSSVDQKLAELDKNNLAGERIAFLLSMDGSKLRLAGEGTGGQSFIELVKATNVADFKNYRNISAESLFEMRPSVIIVAGSDVDSAVQSLLDENPVLTHTPAVKQKRIIAVNGSTLVAGLSVSAIDEAIRLTQALSDLQTRSNPQTLAVQEKN